MVIVKVEDIRNLVTGKFDIFYIRAADIGQFATDVIEDFSLAMCTPPNLEQVEAKYTRDSVFRNSGRLTASRVNLRVRREIPAEVNALYYDAGSWKADFRSAKMLTGFTDTTIIQFNYEIWLNLLADRKRNAELTFEYEDDLADWEDGGNVGDRPEAPELINELGNWEDLPWKLMIHTVDTFMLIDEANIDPQLKHTMMIMTIVFSLWYMADLPEDTAMEFTADWMKPEQNDRACQNFTQSIVECQRAIGDNVTCVNSPYTTVMTDEGLATTLRAIHAPADAQAKVVVIAKFVAVCLASHNSGRAVLQKQVRGVNKGSAGVGPNAAVIRMIYQTVLRQDNPPDDWLSVTHLGNELLTMLGKKSISDVARTFRTQGNLYELIQRMRGMVPTHIFDTSITQTGTPGDHLHWVNKQIFEVKPAPVNAQRAIALLYPNAYRNDLLNFSNFSMHLIMAISHAVNPGDFSANKKIEVLMMASELIIRESNMHPILMATLVKQWGEMNIGFALYSQDVIDHTKAVNYSKEERSNARIVRRLADNFMGNKNQSSQFLDLIARIKKKALSHETEHQLAAYAGEVPDTLLEAANYESIISFNGIVADDNEHVFLVFTRKLEAGGVQLEKLRKPLRPSAVYIEAIDAFNTVQGRQQMQMPTWYHQQLVPFVCIHREYSRMFECLTDMEENHEEYHVNQDSVKEYLRLFKQGLCNVSCVATLQSMYVIRASLHYVYNTGKTATAK